MAHKSGLSVFIVDDEPNALKQLADDLRQQPEIAEVRTFSNYTEAMSAEKRRAALPLQ